MVAQARFVDRLDRERDAGALSALLAALAQQPAAQSLSLDRLPGAIAGENIAIEYASRTASWNGCSRLLRIWSGSAGHCRHQLQSGHGCGHEGDHDHPDRHDQQCRSSWAWSVASLARPGGNVTGLTPDGHGSEILGKRFELLSSV